ncbi:DUF3106 domain-containing protein [Oryzisolibacter sp. LB2S]|uniref:DUF3106 domain-containing protein n=1 Tax=Alicycliphilus soli TaxID=3228789 RepID=UPI00345A38F2
MHASRTRNITRTVPAFVLAFVLLGLLAAGGWWMAVYTRVAPSTPVPVQALGGGRLKAHGGARPVVQPEVGPPWSSLTTRQKEALYPLANRWALLSEVQKRNWLNLAAGFHALSPDEQAKMLERITDWASLSAQQRSQARLNYAAAARLPADTRRAQWEAYQALSEEEKARLAAKAAPRPKGAATAVRPVPPKKLARVPAAASAPPAAPNPPKIVPPADIQPPAPALPPAPVKVETAPIVVPSAVSTPLPPLEPAAAPAEAPAEPRRDNPPLYTPG